MLVAEYLPRLYERSVARFRNPCGDESQQQDIPRVVGEQPNGRGIADQRDLGCSSREEKTGKESNPADERHRKAAFRRYGERER